MLHSKQVEAWYLAREQLYQFEKPYMITFDVSHLDIKKTNHKYTVHNVSMNDVRKQIKNFSLDVNGFSFLHAQTSLSNSDFDDEDILRSKYYPEVIELIKRVFKNATGFHIFGHLRRKRPKYFFEDAMEASGFSAPIVYAHTDYTPDGARIELADFLKDNPSLADRDFDIINIWRVTEGPNNDWPLALCDFTTVDSQDLETNDVIHKAHVGESRRAYHNPRHEWYFMSNQKIDEVALFRNTNSGEIMKPFALHLAFKNDEASPPRQSIEIRVACFY